MEDRIRRRIAEVEEAEVEARIRLSAIQTVLAELRALLDPESDAPQLSGDPLDEAAP